MLLHRHSDRWCVVLLGDLVILRIRQEDSDKNLY